MWLRRRRDTDTGRHRHLEAQVVAEAECLLTGRLLDRGSLRSRQGARIIINTLAHSDLTQLQRVADNGMAHPSSWGCTLEYLVAELLSVAPIEGSLLAVQRQILVPIEVQLLSNDPLRGPTPAQLVNLILGALSTYQQNPDL